MKFILVTLLVSVVRCSFAQSIDSTFTDTAFDQEYHVPYPVRGTQLQNNVKRILVDRNDRIWIATAGGLLRRSVADTSWSVVPLPGTNSGPVYALSLLPDSALVAGSWNGLHVLSGGDVHVVPGTDGPISVLCAAKEGVYAFGPKGAWLFNGKAVEKKSWPIARSVRAAISDGVGGVWLASEVGLYHCTDAKTDHYVDTNYLISASLRGLAFSAPGRLWAGGLGGVSALHDGMLINKITTRDGNPSNEVHCVQRAPDGTMWLGTNVGIRPVCTRWQSLPPLHPQVAARRPCQ